VTGSKLVLAVAGTLGLLLAPRPASADDADPAPSEVDEPAEASEPLPEPPPAPEGAVQPEPTAPEGAPAPTPPVAESAAPAAPPPSMMLPMPVAPVADAPPMKSSWYGGQILLVDALSIGVIVLGAGSSDGAEALVPMGVGGYLLGGPIVHWGHGNVGKGFGSLGLRVGAPIVGAFAGAGMEDCSGGGELCGLAGAFVGFLVGVTAAIVIDSAALAYEEVPAQTEAIRVVPSLGASRDGLSLGLSGSF
jgi:hypothetical protein